MVPRRNVPQGSWYPILAQGLIGESCQLQKDLVNGHDVVLGVNWSPTCTHPEENEWLFDWIWSWIIEPKWNGNERWDWFPEQMNGPHLQRWRTVCGKIQDKLVEYINKEENLTQNKGAEATWRFCKRHLLTRLDGLPKVLGQFNCFLWTSCDHLKLNRL